MTHMLLTWNRSVSVISIRSVSDQYQIIIIKQITETVTCSKSAANGLGLSKQDNSNGTCAADVVQIIIRLISNTVNKITEIMTCSKSTANTSGSCKQNIIDSVCNSAYWWHWTDHYVVETYTMTSKY